MLLGGVLPEHRVCVLESMEKEEDEKEDEEEQGDTAVACAQVGRGHVAYSLLSTEDTPIPGLVLKFARHAGAGVHPGRWSVEQHAQFPRTARERARTLLVLCAQLDRKRGPGEESLLDVWIAHVMPELVSADWLRVGCTVRIVGLVQAARWNGQYALVVGYQDDRIAVQVLPKHRPHCGGGVRVCDPMGIMLDTPGKRAVPAGHVVRELGPGLLVRQPNLHVVTFGEQLPEPLDDGTERVGIASAKLRGPGSRLWLTARA
jgi:hypothetical protein